ncbi:DUF3806 domain-containing protein [Seongchinamella sediminis]|uniref:DUF3806 domain-containing protein n=1 Tax=Seongchinamella sediminis TaxID=2283635 RepID=A0A3L7DXN3_9GAMM|nr:DUF3806 domain-containing protein [Seongchinamella sediminis]RLQ21946.1 DUF3806 domain-containing protein [Seongchinamella sediminis]
MTPLHRLLLVLLTLALSAGQPARAQDELTVSELSALDRHYMQSQRQQLNELAARHYGRQFTGDRERDLALMQRLLDEGVVRGNQTGLLQGMGIVLGDLLAADLDLDWVVYEDRAGRSRALRYRETDSYLFPVTMISRRREVGNTTPVSEIYRKAEASIRSSIPPLPFQ